MFCASKGDDMLHPGAVMRVSSYCWLQTQVAHVWISAPPLRNTLSLDSLISLSTVKVPFLVGCVQEGEGLAIKDKAGVCNGKQGAG